MPIRPLLIIPWSVFTQELFELGLEPRCSYLRGKQIYNGIRLNKFTLVVTRLSSVVRIVKVDRVPVLVRINMNVPDPNLMR